MINIQVSTQVSRPRSEVFEFLTEVDNFPRWQSGVSEAASLTPGALHVGSQFTEAASIGPWKLRIVGTVTDLKVNERLAFQARSSGPLDCDVRIDLQPIAGGTRVTLSGAARLKGFWRLLQPMLARELRNETQAELASLKQLLEAPATQPASAAI